MRNTELSFDSCRSLAYAAITIGLSIKSQPPFSGFHGVKRPCPDIDILPESGINGNLNFIYQKKMRFSGKDTLTMRAVDIGITWFPNPSPKLNANTAVCLVMPTISATGVKIGITTAARPEPDVMTGFKAKLIQYMQIPRRKDGNAFKTNVHPYTIVSRIFAEDKTPEVALASPKIMAETVSFLHPSAK